MFKYIKKQIPILIILTVITLSYTFFEIKYSLLLLNIIDQTIIGNMDGFTQDIITLLIYILIVCVGYIIIDFIKVIFFKATGKSIKSKFLSRIFKKNLNEFQEENNSIYLSTLTNDYDVIESNYLIPITDIINSIITFASGVIIFITVEPSILLVCLGLMVINVIVSFIGSKPLNKHNEERSNIFGRYTSYIKEVLSAFHIIKANDLQDKIKKDYQSKSAEVQNKGYVIDKIQSFIFAIQNVNFQITFMGLFLIIAYMTIQGKITFGAVVLIIQTAEKLIWPVTVITESIPKLLSVKSIVRKMDNSIKNKYDYEETLDFTSFNDNITFNDVSFSYDNNHVLDQLNLVFEKGKKYLIVGPSGGGKSTVLRLLRKYFNPQAGNILIDNQPLTDIKKEQYFNLIANIEQNVFLFEDSIKNNLTLYKDYSDDQINDALKRAGLNDFIKSLPNGINTIIYENGKNISGGERSRIAIARGLLNKSQIIFLDEAFASLDYDRAKEIERSILDLKDVTVINVSHVVIKENKDDYDQVYLVNKKKAIPLVSEG